jgi:hypothetical protein
MNEDVALQKLGDRQRCQRHSLKATDEYIPANIDTGRAQNVASIYNI